MPLWNVDLQPALPMPKSWDLSFSQYEIREEIIEIEESGFDDIDKEDNLRDFDEYKSEDFANSLHLETEEDSFAFESQLSVAFEEVERNF